MKTKHLSFIIAATCAAHTYGSDTKELGVRVQENTSALKVGR